LPPLISKGQKQFLRPVLNLRKDLKTLLSKNSYMNDEEKRKMFIDTCSIVDFVDRIYFAPNAADMDFFQEKLVYDGVKHITCYQCEHPIRTRKA
jgi:hypothetical protein